ncbi:MAG: YfhO family protein [Lachnospiraceae bacterium]|nr:YfhO family protein [Lachnospiraceae bacterium]
MKQMKIKLKGLCINLINSFEERRRTYYAIYTIAFLFIAFICFSPFIFSGRSLIWYDDGWDQHFKALIYYSQYLRNILRSIVYEGKIIIPNWDFYIGEGNDVLSTFHYYVMGDPFAFLSVFVPTQWMAYHYSFMCILRMYLAGIAFSALCFETGRQNHYSILAGSIAYALCNWALNAATNHPYFENPMIFFPLMILGIERIIKKKGSLVFILATAISAISNFYFFYMIVLLTIVYVLVRVILIYHKDIKKIAIIIARIGIAAVAGACIAGIVLLPVLITIVKDSRIGVSQPFHLLYGLDYYSRLPAVMISEKMASWLNMGIVAPTVISILMLFINRKKEENGKIFRILFIICVLIVLFPMAGRILNGMSYACNRWCWGFVLLCCYILVFEWDELMHISAGKVNLLAICSFGLVVLLFISEESRSFSAMTSMALVFAVIIVINFEELRIKQFMIIFLVMIGIINVAYWRFSYAGLGKLYGCKKYSEIWEEWNDNETQYVKNIDGNPYMRYSGSKVSNNTNIINRVSNTQYYWSVSSPYLARFRQDVDIIEPKSYYYYGYDGRTTLNELAAVKYYVTGEGGTAPYGYTEEEKIAGSAGDKYIIYKNQYPLDIGYCYSSYITKKEWDQLSSVQKQEIELETAYCDGIPDGINNYNGKIDDYVIPYEIELTGEVVQTNGGFITTADNTSIKLNLSDKCENKEIYVGVKGLEFTATPEYDLYFGDDSVDPNKLYNKTNWQLLDNNVRMRIKKEKRLWDPIVGCTIGVSIPEGFVSEIDYLQPDEEYSSGRHDYIANLGCKEQGVDYVVLTLPKPGFYSFESIRIYGISMDGYIDKARLLQENMLSNIQISTDTLMGNIKTDSNKLLCMAIPYSKGWKGYVDNVETKVYCLNDKYIGMVIPEGGHSVMIRYTTPYKKSGGIISALGIIIAMVIVMMERKERKKSKILCEGNDAG